MKTNEEVAEKVIQFPAGEHQLTPEELEIEQKMDAIIKPEQELIAQITSSILDVIDEAAVEKKKEEPDFELMVHIPLESLFTSIPVFLNHAHPMTQEEVERYVPMVQKLSGMLRKTTDDFFNENGMELPIDIALFGFANAAATMVQEQRVLVTYERVTGVDIETEMGADNDEN